MPRLPRREYSTRLSRVLRSNLTPEEARLWTVLRHDFSEKFRRQEPLGPYIVDFVCYEHRLIIEVDGVQHAESEADQQRDFYLARLGFRVLRVWNGEVMYQLSNVTDWIEFELSADRRATQPTRRGNARSARDSAVAGQVWRPPPSPPKTAAPPPPDGEE